MKRVTLFNSYAHDDKGHAEQLMSGLQLRLKCDRQFQFEVWRDTAILVGENWDVQIREALKSCDSGLLFLSPSFLTSSYIANVELDQLQADGKILMPVMLCGIDFDRMDLKGLDRNQIFMLNGRCYSSLTTPNQKNAFIHGLYTQIHDRIKKENGL